MLGYWKDI